MNVILIIVAIIAVIALFKIMTTPIKILAKLFINGVVGLVILFVVNFVGQYIQVYIPINAGTVLIAGFLGIPGVVFLIIFTTLVK